MISVFHYKNWFSSEECDELVEYALKKAPAKGRILDGGSGEKEHAMRECELRWLNRSAPEMQGLTARIDHLFIDAQVNAFGMKHIFGFKDLQFTTYRGDNQGHYDFHRDNGTTAVGADRRISMILLLSDPNDFEGGQFEMKPRLYPHCLSAKGDVLFFRSELLHRVLPVTGGTRHSLVTWFLGRRPEE